MDIRVETLLALVVGLCAIVSLEAQLQVGFYRTSCGLAEFIIKDEVRRAFISDRGVAAGLARMHFHDCFVGGCDGSVLIDSTPQNTAEKDAPPNNPSLRGFEVIDNAKAILENLCRGIVSCADILAFAARDSVEMFVVDPDPLVSTYKDLYPELKMINLKQMGGVGYDVPAGRRDGRVSLASEAVANLPAPAFNLDQLTQAFANKGFTQDEMVTLSGAHTIGRSHCTAFSNRLYSFNSTTSQDPSLDPNYAALLKRQCPQGSTDPNLVVPMDPTSPNSMDTSYYQNICMNRGLFTSDQTLLTNTATSNQVSQNAVNPFLWKINFAAAMVKMGQMSVLTGSAGEIHLNCRVIN